MLQFHSSGQWHLSLSVLKVHFKWRVQGKASEKQKFCYIISGVYVCVCLVTQSCPTLCDFIDCSPPGSSVCEILQARILKWVAISSFRGSSKPRDRTHVSCVGGGFLTHWTIREAPVLVTTFYQTPLLNRITFISFALVTLSSFMKEGKSESHSVVSVTPWTVTAFSRLFCL